MTEKYISYILLLKENFNANFQISKGVDYRDDLLLFSEPFSINVENISEKLFLCM